MKILPHSPFLLLLSTVEILVLASNTQNSTLPELHEDYSHFDNSSSTEDYFEDEVVDQCSSVQCIEFDKIGSPGVTVDYTTCNGYFYTDESTDEQCRQSLLPASVPNTFGSNVKECCGFHGFFVQGDCGGSDGDGKEVLVTGVHLCYNVEEERDFDDVDALPQIPKKALDCPASCSVKTIWMFPDDPLPNITKNDSDAPVLSEDGEEYQEFCMAYSCMDFTEAGWQVSSDVCNCPDEPEQPVEVRDSGETIETQQDEGIEEPERTTSGKKDSVHTNKEMLKTGRNKANQPNLFGGFYGLIFYHCTLHITLYLLNLTIKDRLKD